MCVNLWQNYVDADFSFAKLVFKKPGTQACMILMNAAACVHDTAEDMKPTWSPMEIWYLHRKCMNSYTDIKVDMSRAVQLQGTENAEWPERKGCMSKQSINRPKCRLTWENINFLLLNAVVEGEKKQLLCPCGEVCFCLRWPKPWNREGERETLRDLSCVCVCLLSKVMGLGEERNKKK